LGKDRIRLGKRKTGAYKTGSPSGSRTPSGSLNRQFVDTHQQYAGLEKEAAGRGVQAEVVKLGALD